MKASQTGTEATLHHRIEGRGDAVVLLHPVGLDLHCWDAIAPDLARTRTVIRVDLRGHGGSRAADPATSLSDYAADLDALLGALAVGPAAVVGLSFGGMVAQTLAIEHPRAVARTRRRRLPEHPFARSAEDFLGARRSGAPRRHGGGSR